MQFRFLHAADIHLGYEQYNHPERFNDFARAFFAFTDYADSTHPDFVLIAGDLFNRANPDAYTVNQATVGLARLRDAGIPVIAIEGNHDAQHARKYISWMEYLCDQRLLCLLNVYRADNGYVSLVPFSETERRGSYLDVAGARIYGIKYFGAATARIVEQVAGDIEPAPYTIMMLHAGMEGQVPNMHGGLTSAQLLPLQDRVDYLALGHVHKRLMAEGDWIFNPGSTETNSFEEIDWAHGFFDVQVDTEAAAKHHVTPVETPGLRPFRRLAVNADDTASLDEFLEKVERAMEQARGIPEGAVLELALSGAAEFRRQDVPLERLRADLAVRFRPLVARVRNNLVPPGPVHVRRGEGMSRAELERQVIEHLVRQDGERREIAPIWSRLIVDVKNMAAEKDIPAAIHDHVRSALDGMPDGTSA